MGRGVSIAAISATLLLVGCGQQPTTGPDPAVDRNTESTGKAVQGAKDNVTLDCASALSVSVAVEAGAVYTPQAQVSLLVEQPVRIIVQSDAPTTVDLRGSETYEIVDLQPGVSAVCTTYRAAGQYPLQIGDAIPLVFQVG